MQLVTSSIGIKDLANDPIIQVNGTIGSWTAASLVTDMPHCFFWEQTSLGIDMLCVARIDGQPLVIEASNNNTPYNPVITDYDYFIGGHGIHSHPRPIKP